MCGLSVSRIPVQPKVPPRPLFGKGWPGKISSPSCGLPHHMGEVPEGWRGTGSVGVIATSGQAGTSDALASPVARKLKSSRDLLPLPPPPPRPPPPPPPPPQWAVGGGGIPHRRTTTPAP